mgnify:FL=1
MIKARVSNIPMLVSIEVTEKVPEKVNNKILKLGEKMAEESFEIRLIRAHYATSL